MQTLLAITRYAGLAVFAVSAVLVLLTLLNYIVEFSDVYWLEITLMRLYLFFAVVGILGYILVTFRRREDDPK